MMKKYDKYKQSGIEWVGEIPSDWNVTKYKFVITIKNGFPFKSELFDNQEGFPLLRIRDITSGKLETFYKGEFSSDYVIKKGDLVIGMDGDFNLRWWDNSDALLNQRCCTLNNIEGITDLRFLYYLLPNDLKIINDLTYYTTVKHLSNGDINNSSIVLPPIDEQTQIAQYLDHQTSIIDQLIQQKEKLIELLKEKKQAVINEAVTQGLNPKAKMKDSGIEWLGKVPEEWTLTKMKFGCEFIYDGTHGSFMRIDQGFRLLSVRNIVDSKFIFREDDSLISEKDYNEISSKFIIKEDDIQLAIVGATLGKVAIVEKMSEPFVTQRSLATIRTDSKICLPKYLYYYLSSSSFQAYLWLSTSFSAQPGVYLGTIQKCPLLLPSINEQYQIVKFLQLKIYFIDELTNKNIIQIEKLKEYRQSIISEAVTGKIDLRSWTPPNNN